MTQAGVTGAITLTFENRTAGTRTLMVPAPSDATKRVRVLAFAVSGPSADADWDIGDVGFITDQLGTGWRAGRWGPAKKLPEFRPYNPAGWFTCAAGKGLEASNAACGAVTYVLV